MSRCSLESAQAEGGGKPYIQGGPCSQFPDCNQHCIDLKYPGGGKCIKCGFRFKKQGEKKSGDGVSS
ncbi:hypothetical protein YC2023_100293 [Brassica napus]